MKKVVLTLAFVLTTLFAGSILGQVSIGTLTAPDESAALDVKPENPLGVLVPRMTEAERDGIVNPANSLLIYNIDEDCFNYYAVESNGSGEWVSLCGGLSKAVFTINDCDDITVHGIYVEGTSVNGSNYLSINVNVTKAGSYTIAATTDNGYGFFTQGTFLTLGEQTVLVPAQGKPLAANNLTTPDLVTLVFSGEHVSECTTLAITVLGPTATYEMICGSAIVNGAYVKGRALGAGNTITMTVNVSDVSTGGSWAVRSNTNSGISFEGSGIFVAPGMQTITLQGFGTPTTTQPITLTLTSNSRDGESTCNVTIRVAYPRMTVYGIGYGNAYAYNPATIPGDFNTMMTSVINFGLTDASTVKAEGFTFINGGANPSNATLSAALGGSSPPDIVIFGYPFSGDEATAQILLDYLQKKGVVLFYAESGTTVRAMMRAIFGDMSIGYASGGTGGTRYLMPILTTDPILNGPFGDIGGKYWGEDASTSVVVTGIQYNPNATVYNNYSSGVTSFRHNSMNFVYVGDGGFNSGASNSSGTTLCPFALDGSNRPIPKANYGPGSGTTTGPVYNSVFTANAIAWALEKATYEGINPH